MSGESTSYDILKRFPYEIWSKCISLAIYRAPEGPLSLLNVSAHWQKLLLDSPEMWSYIHVEDGDDVGSRVHTFLHLSGRQPLELCFFPPDSSWIILKQLIMLHSERITSIYLRDWHFNSDRINESLEGTCFPAVHTIDILGYRTTSIIKPLLGLCPGLQYLYGFSFNQGNSDLVTEQFRTMIVDLVLFDHAPHLHPSSNKFIQLPCLESLNITFRVETPEIHQPDDSLSKQLKPESFILSSKTLRQLQVATDLRPAIKGIASSFLGHIHSLTIATIYSNLDILIQAFPSMPLLQGLDLFLQCDKALQKCPPLKQSDIPQLRQFKLDMKSASSIFLTGILDVLTNNDALVCVETFEFIGNYRKYPELVDVYRMIYSVRNATSVIIPHLLDEPPLESDDDSFIHLPIHMPNLFHLRTSFSLLLTQIDAPSLHSLQILETNRPKTIHLPDHFPPAVAVLEIEGKTLDNLITRRSNHWNSLQHIKWTNCKSFLGSKTATFQSIHTVDFTESHAQNYDPTHALNTFLVALLRHPDGCPHLHTVKSWEYPLWELLAQVLVQRIENTDVVQLQEIWFAALPCKPLLSLVMRLMDGGSNRAIPNNVDYILLRRFQHQLIGACRYCICAGYLCCGYNKYFSLLDNSHLWWQWREDGSKQDRRSEQDYQELLELNLDPLFPHEPVLSSSSDIGASATPIVTWKEWEDRLQEMKDGWKKWPKGVTRRAQCIRHRFMRLVHISRYSLPSRGY